MYNLKWITETLRVELGIPQQSIKGAAGGSQFIVAVDKRCLKRYRRRAARLRPFTKEQLEYGCRMAIDYFLQHDPAELIDTTDRLRGFRG